MANSHFQLHLPLPSCGCHVTKHVRTYVLCTYVQEIHMCACTHTHMYVSWIYTYIDIRTYYVHTEFSRFTFLWLRRFWQLWVLRMQCLRTYPEKPIWLQNAHQKLHIMNKFCASITTCRICSHCSSIYVRMVMDFSYLWGCRWVVEHYGD